MVNIAALAMFSTTARLQLGGDTPSGAIQSAEIETFGNVLRIVVQATPGSFASYTLDPDAASPRVTLSARSPGFVPSGGEAVPGWRVRTIAARRALRLPVAFATPSVKVVDETNNGDGTITVRLSLAETVYAGDDQITLAVLAGWRTGLAEQSNISVTNNSIRVRPIPIMRWMQASYTVVGPGQDLRLSLDVSSHHPVNFQPLAGVKFTVTDGTTTITRWVTALATDNSMGDNLRCYTLVIPAADLVSAGFTAGLLRCDAEDYPWLGAMRSTDPAGTRSMANLRTDGWLVDAARPHVVGYDPAGTRYGQMWAMVDPVNGTTTASAAMVATTLAGAKAVAAASRPRDISTAVQAGYLVNRTLAAANGQASQTRSIDGMNIVLPAGTSTSGATAVTTGLATAEIPMRIIGDPDDADPRANCLWHSSVAAPNVRATRAAVANVSLGLGTNSLLGTPTIYWQTDNVTGAGRTGLEANTTAFSGAAPPAGQFNLFATRTRWWRYGGGITQGNVRAGLVRACEHSRSVTALAYVKNRFIGNVEDNFIGTTGVPAYQAWASPTLAGQVEDIVIKWNDMRFQRVRAITINYLPAATAGTPNPSMRRWAIIGNVMEKIGTDPQPFYSMGEDVSATMSYNIIEGNTKAGERANTFYSDPLPAVLADCDTQVNQAFCNRVTNDVDDWRATKHDDFNDPTTATIRAAAGGAETAKQGYRPQMVETWSMLYGTDHEANVDCRRINIGTEFPLEDFGPRSVYTASALSPNYTADASVAGTGAGGGNYAPTAGSVLAGLVMNANCDRDFANNVRGAASHAGAFA